MQGQNQTQENIEVLAKFSCNKILPLAFRYRERTVKIKSIDLKYSFKSGAVDIYVFNVSGPSGSYQITYDSLLLNWTLEEFSEAK